MTDDIRALTARMAEEPGSLAFLELAEALRRRGQLEAAYKVARGGLARYPGLADAHDLMARVLSDQGDLAGAFDAWSSALQLDPDADQRAQGHRVPLLPRGRRGRRRSSTCSARMDVDPDDRSIRAGARAGSARERRGTRPRRGGGQAATTRQPAVAAPPAGRRHGRRTSGLFDGVDGGERGLLLVDANGLRLGGELRRPRTAATRAIASRPSSPASRVRRRAPPGCSASGAGTRSRSSRPTATWCWRSATADTVLLAAREPSLPMGRVDAARRARRARRPGVAGGAAMTRRPRPRSIG